MSNISKSGLIMLGILMWLFPASSVDGFDSIRSVEPIPLEVTVPEISVVAFEVPAFELWNGTELEPISLPNIDLLEDAILPGSSENLHLQDAQTQQNQSALSSELQFKEPGNEAPLMTRSQSSTSGLTFADPIDFEAWKLVKWTLVVLVIAGSVTYFMRGKRLPNLNHPGSEKLKLVESLSIDVRTKVHLLCLENERYLVATDLNGVKSMTLVPSWSIDSESSATQDASSFE